VSAPIYRALLPPFGVHVTQMGSRAALVVALLAAAAAAAPVRGRRLYNTTAAPVAGRVNVHILAHSHDDVGG
jgi:hypothetical protein